VVHDQFLKSVQPHLQSVESFPGDIRLLAGPASGEDALPQGLR